MQVKIESGIPIDAAYRKPANSSWARTFRAMKIGDSFALPKTKMYSCKTAVIRYRDQFDSQYEMEFRQEAPGIYRAWRLK